MLRAGDAALGERVAARALTIEGLAVVHRRQRVAFRGPVYHGIARLELLEALEARALELGAELRFEAPVADPRSLARECDLLVGADGFGSAVRRALAGELGATLSPKPNRHIWYGTPRPFEGVTLAFRGHAAGLFTAHAYRTDAATSTLIVDCAESAWARAGLASLDDAATRALFEGVFRDDLGGCPLLSRAAPGGPAKWIHFTQVRCARWAHGNVALVGDAAHTTHFSAGAGTTLALADALALSRALEAAKDDVPVALAAYEAARRPILDETQARSERHREWTDRAVEFLDLAPLDFAAKLLSCGDDAAIPEARAAASAPTDLFPEAKMDAKPKAKAKRPPRAKRRG